MVELSRHWSALELETMRTIVQIADFTLPFLPLLILGQWAMDAFPLSNGERSWAGALVVLLVAGPLFAWAMHTVVRLTRRGEVARNS